MPFHELAHIEADHGVLVVEHHLGQGLAQFGLAHAGGAEKDERSDGPPGILQAGAAAADRVGNRLDRLVLAHQAVMDAFFQHQQLGPFRFQHAGDRNARPGADDFGDLVVGDLLAQQPAGSAVSAIGFDSLVDPSASTRWRSSRR